MNITFQFMMNAKLSQQRVWPCASSKSAFLHHRVRKVYSGYHTEDTVFLPCFYKRRDKNNSPSKSGHLRSLSHPINEYIFHFSYPIFIIALKKPRFLAKNSRKLLKSLENFTFFSLSFNSKNRLISPPL